MTIMFNKPSKIYAIVDQETCLENDIEVLEFVTILYEAGIQILQYRNKLENMLFAGETFEEIIQITSDELTYIINDYEEIANRYIEKENVLLHCGQTDNLKNPARKFGRSTHNIPEIENTLKENRQPEYIGFGAMFSSPTKPGVAPSYDQLNQALKVWQKDIVLIGGITAENIHLLPKEDRIYYAVISDFFSSGNQPAEIEQQIKKLFTGASIN
jgi:thiamine-phosphate pyrophosphorylase